MDAQPTRIHFDVPHGDPEQHAALMERLGHPSTKCHGPEEGQTCPLLVDEGHCPLIEDAHGVVFEFDLDDDQHRRILGRYLEVIPEDVPLRVITTPEMYERHKGMLSGIDVWTHGPTTGELDGFAALVEASDNMREAEQTD